MAVKVNPVTLRPEIETVEEKDNQERNRLEAQAANRMITESPDGRKVIDIITKRLFGRIEKVLEDDPECKSLVAVLQDLGATERIAKNAVDQLVKRFLRLEPKQGVM